MGGAGNDGRMNKRFRIALGLGVRRGRAGENYADLSLVEEAAKRLPPPQPE